MRARDETERRAGRVGLGVLESVPPGVGLAEDLAGYVVPVLLGVLGAGNGLGRGSAAYGPAGLSNPDRLTVGSSGGVAIGLKEEVGAVLNAIGIDGLEVGVRVNTQEIAVVDDSGV